jgi:protocatechuate 3,4-dioxygenase beta subunit
MKKLAVGLALLVSILAAVLGWTYLTPRETAAPAIAAAPLERTATPDPVAPQADAEPSDRLAQELPAITSSDAGKGRTALVVVVRRVEDESAVVGVEVDVYLDRERREGRTDEAGRCRFEAEAGAWFTSVRVAATAETTSVFWGERRQLPDAGEVELVLRVSRGASVAGSVVDESGRPVAGAQIKGWCGIGYERALAPDRTATAGPDGGFVLAHLGAAFHVIAEAPGLACIEGLKGELGPGDLVDDARLVLATAADLRGRVLALGSDLPIEGALVAVSDKDVLGKTPAHSGVYGFRPARGQAHSGADGVFALDALPRKPLVATVTGDGFQRWQGTLEPGRDDQVVRLAKGAQASGRVLDHAGRPVEGASVRFRENNVNTVRAVSDAHGEFHLRGLGATESGTLFVHAKGHAAFVRQPVAISESLPNWLEVRLEPALALAGTVVDGDGNPVPRASLTIEGDRAVVYEDARYASKMTWERVLNLNAAHSGEDGRFRFEDLYAGSFTIAVRTEASPEVQAEMTAPSGSEDLLVRLDARPEDRVTLVGRVTDASSGEPVRDFTLIPMLPTPNGGQTGNNHRISDPDGRFRVAGLPAGPISLIVRANGYASWRDELREYARGEHALELALYRSRALGVRVLDRSGRAVQGEIGFRTLDGLEIWLEFAPGSTTPRLTLVEGVATAKGLPADRVQLVVRTADRGTEWPFDVDLRVEPPGVLEFTLPVDSIGVVHWSVIVCGARPGADLRCFDGPYREKWMAELRSPGDAWLIDRELDVRFVSASGEAVATVSLRPAGEHGYKARWARESWGGEFEIETPILALQIPVDTVRAELRAPGYQPLDLPIDVSSAPGPMRAVFLTRTP